MKHLIQDFIIVLKDECLGQWRERFDKESEHGIQSKGGKGK